MLPLAPTDLIPMRSLGVRFPLAPTDLVIGVGLAFRALDRGCQVAHPRFLRPPSLETLACLACRIFSGSNLPPGALTPAGQAQKPPPFQNPQVGAATSRQNLGGRAVPNLGRTRRDVRTRRPSFLTGERDVPQAPELARDRPPLDMPLLVEAAAGLDERVRRQRREQPSILDRVVANPTAPSVGLRSCKPPAEPRTRMLI